MAAILKMAAILFFFVGSVPQMIYGTKSNVRAKNKTISTICSILPLIQPRPR